MWTQSDTGMCVHRGKTMGGTAERLLYSQTRNHACRHLDLRHLASRTMGNYWMVVWTFQSLVFCYGGPSKPRRGIKWFLTAHSCTAITLVHGDGFVLTPIISKLCTYISYSFPTLYHFIIAIVIRYFLPDQTVYNSRSLCLSWASVAKINACYYTDNTWVKLILNSKFTNKSVPFASDKMKGLFHNRSPK